MVDKEHCRVRALIGCDVLCLDLVTSITTNYKCFYSVFCPCTNAASTTSFMRLVAKMIHLYLLMHAGTDSHLCVNQKNKNYVRRIT